VAGALAVAAAAAWLAVGAAWVAQLARGLRSLSGELHDGVLGPFVSLLPIVGMLLPAALSPTLAIEVAPPALAGNAYLAQDRRRHRGDRLLSDHRRGRRTITAPRTISREILRRKASNYDGHDPAPRRPGSSLSADSGPCQDQDQR